MLVRTGIVLFDVVSQMLISNMSKLRLHVWEASNASAEDHSLHCCCKSPVSCEVRSEQVSFQTLLIFEHFCMSIWIWSLLCDGISLTLCSSTLRYKITNQRVSVTGGTDLTRGMGKVISNWQCFFGDIFVKFQGCLWFCCFQFVCPMFVLDATNFTCRYMIRMNLMLWQMR